MWTWIRAQPGPEVLKALVVLWFSDRGLAKKSTSMPRSQFTCPPANHRRRPGEEPGQPDTGELLDRRGRCKLCEEPALANNSGFCGNGCREAKRAASGGTSYQPKKKKNQGKQPVEKKKGSGEGK